MRPKTRFFPKNPPGFQDFPGRRQPARAQPKMLQSKGGGCGEESVYTLDAQQGKTPISEGHPPELTTPMEKAAGRVDFRGEEGRL
jgi:hypothetical protein